MAAPRTEELLQIQLPESKESSEFREVPITAGGHCGFECIQRVLQMPDDITSVRADVAQTLENAPREKKEQELILHNLEEFILDPAVNLDPVKIELYNKLGKEITDAEQELLEERKKADHEKENNIAQAMEAAQTANNKKKDFLITDIYPVYCRALRHTYQLGIGSALLYAELQGFNLIIAEQDDNHPYRVQEKFREYTGAGADAPTVYMLHTKSPEDYTLELDSNLADEQLNRLKIYIKTTDRGLEYRVIGLIPNEDDTPKIEQGLIEGLPDAQQILQQKKIYLPIILAKTAEAGHTDTPKRKEHTHYNLLEKIESPKAELEEKAEELKEEEQLPELVLTFSDRPDTDYVYLKAMQEIIGGTYKSGNFTPWLKEESEKNFLNSAHIFVSQGALPFAATMMPIPESVSTLIANINNYESLPELKPAIDRLKDVKQAIEAKELEEKLEEAKKKAQPRPAPQESKQQKILTTISEDQLRSKKLDKLKKFEKQARNMLVKLETLKTKINSQKNKFQSISDGIDKLKLNPQLDEIVRLNEQRDVLIEEHQFNSFSQRNDDLTAVLKAIDYAYQLDIQEQLTHASSEIIALSKQYDAAENILSLMSKSLKQLQITQEQADNLDLLIVDLESNLEDKTWLETINEQKQQLQSIKTNISESKITPEAGSSLRARIEAQESTLEQLEEQYQTLVTKTETALTDAKKEYDDQHPEPVFSIDKLNLQLKELQDLQKHLQKQIPALNNGLMHSNNTIEIINTDFTALTKSRTERIQLLRDAAVFEIKKLSDDEKDNGLLVNKLNNQDEKNKLTRDFLDRSVLPFHTQNTTLNPRMEAEEKRFEIINARIPQTRQNFETILGELKNENLSTEEITRITERLTKLQNQRREIESDLTAHIAAVTAIKKTAEDLEAEYTALKGKHTETQTSLGRQLAQFAQSIPENINDAPDLHFRTLSNRLDEMKATIEAKNAQENPRVVELKRELALQEAEYKKIHDNWEILRDLHTESSDIRHNGATPTVELIQQKIAELKQIEVRLEQLTPRLAKVKRAIQNITQKKDNLEYKPEDLDQIIQRATTLYNHLNTSFKQVAGVRPDDNLDNPTLATDPAEAKIQLAKIKETAENAIQNLTDRYINKTTYQDEKNRLVAITDQFRELTRKIDTKQNLGQTHIRTIYNYQELKGTTFEQWHKETKPGTEFKVSSAETSPQSIPKPALDEKKHEIVFVHNADRKNPGESVGYQRYFLAENKQGQLVPQFEMGTKVMFSENKPDAATTVPHDTLIKIILNGSIQIQKNGQNLSDDAKNAFKQQVYNELPKQFDTSDVRVFLHRHKEYTYANKPISHLSDPICTEFQSVRDTQWETSGDHYQLEVKRKISEFVNAARAFPPPLPEQARKLYIDAGNKPFLMALDRFMAVEQPALDKLKITIEIPDEDNVRKKLKVSKPNFIQRQFFTLKPEHRLTVSTQNTAEVKRALKQLTPSRSFAEWKSDIKGHRR